MTLNEIKAAAKAASKGPWRADNVAEGYTYAGETLIASAQCETLHYCAKGITPAQMNTNAHFIALARTAVPALYEAVDVAIREFEGIATHTPDVNVRAGLAAEHAEYALKEIYKLLEGVG